MLVHTSTVCSRAPTEILAHLHKLSKQHKGHNPLLFALSASPRTSPADLSSLVTHISGTWPGSIGFLSAPHAPDVLSCSVAVFDSARCVPFRSTLAGRPVPQVGRWHASRKKPASDDAGKHVTLEGDVDWEALWSGRSDDSQESLLPELKHLDPQEISSVVYLSDGAPEGISNALRRFSSATRLGVYASSTPFITGRPVTLLRGQEIFSSGAVGFAFTGPKATSSLDIPNMHPITEPMTVSLAEGNLVQQLDGKNPAALLLQALRTSGLDQQSSMDNLYVGLVDGQSLQPHRLYRITSGDPSRGTLALESGDAVAPPAGSTVCIFHHHDRRMSDTAPVNKNSITFSVVSDEILPDGSEYDLEEKQVHDGFLALSENGFLLQRPEDKDAWSCRVSGAKIDLRWPA